MTALHRLVTATTGSRMLGLVRILVGAAALLKAYDMWPVLVAVLEPGNLRVPWTTWLPEFTQASVPVLMTVWVAAAFALLLGWRTRVAGALLTGALGYVLLLDQQLYGNNLYLLTLVVFLLTLGDSGAAVSLDARRDGGRSRVPAWPVQLLKVQLSCVYGAAALAKLNVSYIAGSNVASMNGGVLPLPEPLAVFPMVSALAMASIVAEAWLAVALWSRNWRGGAVVVGLVLHAIIVLFAGAVVELSVFALTTLSLYLLFFQDRIHDGRSDAPVGGSPDWVPASPGAGR